MLETLQEPLELPQSSNLVLDQLCWINSVRFDSSCSVSVQSENRTGITIENVKRNGADSFSGVFRAQLNQLKAAGQDESLRLNQTSWVVVGNESRVELGKSNEPLQVESASLWHNSTAGKSRKNKNVRNSEPEKSKDWTIRWWNDLNTIDDLLRRFADGCVVVSLAAVGAAPSEIRWKTLHKAN